jgi:hypothetical protein
VTAPEPSHTRSGSGGTGYVVIPEPCRAMVLVSRSRGDTRVFLHRGWTWSRKARGDSEALSWWVMGSVPRGTWQHRSPFLEGGAHGASWHVVTSKPFPGGWCALCHGARGDTGALFWQVMCYVPRGTWQSSLAPGMDM